MGKTRLLAVIVAFLIVAILAVLLLPNKEEQPVQEVVEEPTVTVVAAQKEIPAFTFITADMVCLKEVPESAVHANYLSRTEDVIGRRSLVTIVSDEVIMLNHIIDPNDPANRLSYKIEPGMRAMTVVVDDTTGLCNQIRAGDFVDVIVEVTDLKRAEEAGEEDENTEEENAVDENGENTNIEIKDEAKDGGINPEQEELETLEALNSGRTISLMTLQNIQVLSLDQDTVYAPLGEAGGFYYRQVTLAVTPEEAVKLGWAQYEGKVYLLLRAEDDGELVETEPYGAVKALSKGLTADSVTEGEE